MVTENIVLQNPERFAKPYTISRAKLESAAEVACERLANMAKAHYGQFPSTSSRNFLYAPWGRNDNWTTGLYTGCFWFAYQITGDSFFKDVAESHLDSYKVRLDQRLGLLGHDVGFPYMPSCVAAYKVAGNEYGRDIAIETAKFFIDNAYMMRGRYKFIKRASRPGQPYRTMMDTLMNATLLLWAGKELDNPLFTEAGLNQSVTTEACLIRGDGSSYHHFMFNPPDCEPMRGLTLQGHSDESCWSRGHAWGVYGFATAYEYTKADFLKKLHKDVSYYTLNHLPEDLIPYWDYDFTSGDEPRDTSAGLISACGMHEMAKLLSEDDEQKQIYESAAAQMLDSVIDNCTSDFQTDDGLVLKVTAGKPQGLGIDECGVYGDYFYLEALARYLLGDKFIRHW